MLADVCRSLDVTSAVFDSTSIIWASLAPECVRVLGSVIGSLYLYWQGCSVLAQIINQAHSTGIKSFLPPFLPTLFFPSPPAFLFSKEKAELLKSSGNLDWSCLRKFRQKKKRSARAMSFKSCWPHNPIHAKERFSEQLIQTGWTESNTLSLSSLYCIRWVSNITLTRRALLGLVPPWVKRLWGSKGKQRKIWGVFKSEGRWIKKADPSHPDP